MASKFKLWSIAFRAKPLRERHLSITINYRTIQVQPARGTDRKLVVNASFRNGRLDVVFLTEFLATCGTNA